MSNEPTYDRYGGPSWWRKLLGLSDQFLDAFTGRERLYRCTWCSPGTYVRESNLRLHLVNEHATETVFLGKMIKQGRFEKFKREKVNEAYEETEHTARRR